MRERIIKACEAAGLRGYKVHTDGAGWAMTVCGRRIDVTPRGKAYVNGDTKRPTGIDDAVAQTRAFLEMVYRRTAQSATDAVKRGCDAGRAIGIEPPADPNLYGGGDMTVFEKFGDGFNAVPKGAGVDRSIMLTFSRGRPAALLTCHGKDHDLDATHLRALAAACSRAADEIEEALRAVQP